MYYINNFLNDVNRGLTENPKRLDSKYLYDKKGDELFSRIMWCAEYYPTRCELEIFREQSEAIRDEVFSHGEAFDVIELGPGNAFKSRYLLRSIAAAGHDFTYMPVDISPDVIRLLEKELPAFIPSIRITGYSGDYFEMLGRIMKNN